MDRTSIIEYLLAKPGAVEDYPFDPVTLVLKVGGKMFALVSMNDDPATVSLKCDPIDAQILRDQYSTITAGYHLNKRHWNTITLDGSLPPGVLEHMADESYRLVVAGLPRAIRATLTE